MASTTDVHEVPDDKHQLNERHSPESNDHDLKKPTTTIRYAEGSNPAMEFAPRPGHGPRTDSVELFASRPASVAATDDELSDGYDWSGEEDLVDEEAKFEEHMGNSKNKKRKGWGPKRILTLLFSTFIGSTFLSAVLVTPAVLIQVYWYSHHPTPERRYVKDNIQAWLFWAASNLVVSWGLAMAIDVVPVLIRYFISASWGHVSEHVKTRIEIYDSVKNSIKPFFYAASGWVSWNIIFGHIYNLYDASNPDKSRAYYTRPLQRVVVFFFFFALVICAKRMLGHFIAFSFHRTAYKERIDSTKEALMVIETLRQYRPTVRHGKKSPGPGSVSPFSEKEHSKSLSHALHSVIPRRKVDHHDDAEDADTEDDHASPGGTSSGAHSYVQSSKGKGKGKPWSWYQRSNSRTPPSLPHPEQDLESYPLKYKIPSEPGEATPPHRYPPGSHSPAVANTESEDHPGGRGVRLVQAARVIKNAALHDARNIKGKNEGEGSMSWNVGSSQEAKRLARAIYSRFKDRGRGYLIPSDFNPAFSDEAMAEAAFRVFDQDNNGDISRAEIKNTLVKVYKERRFLSRSMRDVGAALKTLDNILLAFAMLMLFFISISIFDVDVGDSLTSVYSLGIALSFIFKNSASSAFDAIMFLFVTHPYDTGDRCFIDEENLVVKRVGLFATVFIRSDGTETYYFNSQLFTKFITNVRRSGKTFENVTIQVAWRTSLETLDALEARLNKWLSTEENRWYEPSTGVTLQSIHFQRYLTLTIAIGHNGNWQDWGLRSQRRTAFHAAVLYYCRQLGITYYESPIPITDGNRHTALQFPQGSPGITRAETTSTLLNSEGVVETPSSPMTPRSGAYLGFVPPATEPSPLQSTKARRSKSKKVVMRGMDT